MDTTNIPIASLPTRFGDFKIYSFSDDVITLVKGDVQNSKNLLVRIHSKCLTGDVFGSLRCDCRAQLEKSLELISKEGKGIVIYIRPHEGRGIGLKNKIRAYELQDKGADTVEANHQLGFPADNRSYTEAVSVLNYFKLSSIRLLTNNPDKITSLKNNGISISEIIPLITESTEHNKFYLETKKKKLGHTL